MSVNRQPQPETLNRNSSQDKCGSRATDKERDSGQRDNPSGEEEQESCKLHRRRRQAPRFPKRE
jgi:hypothetical protein